MNRRITIAILLISVFIFPNIYQTSHVVNSHWNVKSSNHCSCHHHSGVELSEYNYKFSAEEESPCPICEFEFTAFGKVTHLQQQSISYKYLDLVINEIKEIAFCKHVQVITLRGPPISSFNIVL